MAKWPVDVSLDYKALRFVLAAIDHQLADFDAKLASDALSDDERADLGNDRGYLRALRTTFEGALNRP